MLYLLSQWNIVTSRINNKGAQLILLILLPLLLTLGYMFIGYGAADPFTRSLLCVWQRHQTVKKRACS